MQTDHARRASGTRGGNRQRGVGLIDALIAMVILGLGIIGLLRLYVDAVPVPSENNAQAQAQMAAYSFMALAYENTSKLPVNVSNASSASALPSVFQSWFNTYSASIPKMSVTVVSGADALGNACSPTATCGLTLTISWAQLGQTRSETFYGQVGVS